MIENRIGRYLQSGRSWYKRAVSAIKKITVHHDAIPQDGRHTADSILDRIMKTHVGKGWPGASYHYYIHQDGKIYQLNEHSWVTWHDRVNDDSLGIVLHGYFHPDYNDQPTQAQLDSLKWLLDKLTTQHPEFPAGRSDVLGHRERSSTACPGNNLFPHVVNYREGKWGDTNTPQPDTNCDEIREARDSHWNDLKAEEKKTTLLEETNRQITEELTKTQSKLNTADSRDTARLEQLSKDLHTPYMSTDKERSWDEVLAEVKNYVVIIQERDDFKVKWEKEVQGRKKDYEEYQKELQELRDELAQMVKQIENIDKRVEEKVENGVEPVEVVDPIGTRWSKFWSWVLSIFKGKK